MEDKINLLTDLELVKMSLEGSNFATEKLIKKYEDIVILISKKYISKIGNNHISIDSDVVYQEGRLGIVDAIGSYKEDSNASFRTYVSICIRNRVINSLKKESRNVELLDISLDSEEDVNILDVPSDSNTEEEVLLNELMSDLCSKDNSNFSEFEKTVLRELLRGLTYKEIASELSKSPKSIDNTIQRIKKKILIYLRK